MAYKKYTDVTAVLGEGNDTVIVRSYNSRPANAVWLIANQVDDATKQKNQASLLLSPEKARELAAALKHYADEAEKVFKEK